MDTPGLAQIHDAIDRLRRLRSVVRIGSAACVVVFVALAGLWCLFLLDVAFHAGRFERALLLLLLLGAVAYAVYRFLLPALRTTEDDSALALVIERQQGIDTDLVAAVQFADRDRPQFGSPSLRDAVVAYVEEVLPGLDLLEGFNARALRPYVFAAAAAVAIWLISTIAAPGYVGAFASRVLLTHQLYPTKTRIVEVIEPGAAARAGNEVRFRVKLDGQMPEQATVEVRSVATGKSSVIALEPEPEPDAEGIYAGVLRVVLDSIDYRVVAGDAYTPTRRLKVIPEPRLTLEVRVAPPDYARDMAEAQVTQGTRISALEGSSIDVRLITDQPMREARIAFDETALPMTEGDDGYRLDTAGAPLSPLTQSLTLRAELVDRYGVSLERTPSVTVSMRPDQKPRVSASAVTRQVLPTASPSLDIEASDDLGLGRIVLRQVIVPAQGQPIEFSSEVVDLAGSAREYHQTTKLGLADMTLEPGDRVELTVEAFDYRGQIAGQSAVSPAIVLEVIDRQALLENLLERDRALDQKLKQVIEAELEIGDDP